MRFKVVPRVENSIGGLRGGCAFSLAVLALFWHCLVNMGTPKTPDDVLFKHQPKAVKALNLQARREQRASQRAAWAQANPNNWRLQGKKP